MKRLLVMIGLIFLLSGCASMQYGNYVAISADFSDAMARDSVKQIAQLYPPARTRFILRQSIKDRYGLTLIDMLRKRGYSIVESASPLNQQSTLSAVPMFYLIDMPIPNKLYRVTLVIGQQSISRAYDISNASLQLTGLWSKREL